MPWYIEHDFRPFGNGAPEKKFMELNCPDNLGAREQALKQAIEVVRELNLQNSKLVWKEEIPQVKKRRPA
jgi:hypothetical protein